MKTIENRPVVEIKHHVSPNKGLPRSWYSDTRMHYVRIYWVKLDTAQNNLRDVVPAPKGSRACQNQWTTQAADIFVSCKHLAWAKPTNENVDRNLHDMKTMNTYQETGYISAQNLTKSIVSGQSIAPPRIRLGY